MQPGRHTLVIYRGDTYHWQFQLWMDAERTQPVNLTDAQVKSEIRNRPGGTVIVELELQLELPNIIHATLPAAASSRVPTLGASWDLQITYPNGDVQTVLTGGVTVTPDITDSTPPPPTLVEAVA
jgi:hypothetical protein